MLTVIKPRVSFSLGFREIWNSRELFYIFSWRDIKVRYKQTILGVAWVVFQPLVTMIIFSAFFGRVVKISSGGLPYPLFVYVGLVIWMFFSHAVTQASSSLVENESILKKVYFPRLVIPLSSIVTAGIDLAVTLIILFLIAAYYQHWPTLQLIAIAPLLIFILFMVSAGTGMFLASLNVKYRDVRYILPFFIQIGIFLTPVIYPLSATTDIRRLLLSINPLTGIIETVRVGLMGETITDWTLLLVSMGISLAVFLFGLIYFRKTEAFFADIV